MKTIPEFEDCNERQKYINDHLGELMDDAIDEFNNSKEYDKVLEDRFRQLRPHDHETATYYLDELEKMKP